MHLYRSENSTQRRRSAAGAVAALAACCCGLALTGCGPKEAEETPAPPAPGSTAAAGAPTTGTPADQGKIATGADPDKAPPYPGMYGKPAGAR